MQSARLTTDQNCVGKQKFQIAVLFLTFFFGIRGHAAEIYLAAFQPLTLHIHINQQCIKEAWAEKQKDRSSCTPSNDLNEKNK
jgi:hypothetical protein